MLVFSVWREGIVLGWLAFLVGFNSIHLCCNHQIDLWKGGAAGNEGLGLFALCLDWNYVGSGGGSLGALFTPLSTQLSLYFGTMICMQVSFPPFNYLSILLTKKKKKKTELHSALVTQPILGMDKTSHSYPNLCFSRMERCMINLRFWIRISDLILPS